MEVNYFPVLLSVRALLARLPKRNKRKVVSGSRVTLPVNFVCKPGLSFNPLARVTLTGLPYLLGPKSEFDCCYFVLRYRRFLKAKFNVQFDDQLEFYNVTV